MPYSGYFVIFCLIACFLGMIVVLGIAMVKTVQKRLLKEKQEAEAEQKFHEEIKSSEFDIHCPECGKTFHLDDKVIQMSLQGKILAYEEHITALKHKLEMAEAQRAAAQDRADFYLLSK